MILPNYLVSHSVRLQTSQPLPVKRQRRRGGLFVVPRGTVVSSLSLVGDMATFGFGGGAIVATFGSIKVPTTVDTRTFRGRL